VLSTLHTNDAPNTVTRLVTWDGGLQDRQRAAGHPGPAAAAAALSPLQDQADRSLPERITQYLPAGPAELYQAVGCGECAMTGYRGRFGIVEILVMTPELERLIGRAPPPIQIAAAAKAGGMRSLFESGVRHVVSGETSVEELLRVTEPPREDTPPLPSGARMTMTRPAPPAAPSARRRGRGPRRPPRGPSRRGHPPPDGTWVSQAWRPRMRSSCSRIFRRPGPS
jgi:general secretion pathway protein E